MITKMLLLLQRYYFSDKTHLTIGVETSTTHELCLELQTDGRFHVSIFELPSLWNDLL